MDDTVFITRENFKIFAYSNMTKIVDAGCEHTEYKSWKDITLEKLNNEFIKIGDLNDDTFKGSYTWTQQIDKQYEYRNEDAYIAVNLYPAQSSIVYQCPKCKNIFLQYMEDRGQIRFRLVKPELIKDELASFRFKIEEDGYQSFLNDLGLTKSEFESRILECNKLHGVPVSMKPNEFYIKEYTRIKEDGFPRTFEVVTNKIKILTLMKRFKRST